MRIIELDDLHIFRTVVREGGIIRAAAVLHRVPSNISTRIKQFENRLGKPLFHRQGRHIALTPTGNLLIKHAERLLQMAEEAEQELLHGLQIRHLRLGALESAASARLPLLLSQYYLHHPDTHIELQTGTTAALLRMLDEHQIEAAFVSEPFPKEQYTVAPVFCEELVLISAINYLDTLTPSSLSNQTVVAFPHGCSYRRILVDWFSEMGTTPARFLDLGSYHAIVACVAAGTGIAIIPVSVLDQALQSSGIQRHEMPEKFRWNHTHLVWKDEAPPAVQVLLSQIRA